MIAQIDKQYATIGPLRVIPRLISYLLFEGRPLTTKGRWINPLVFGFSSIVKKMPQMKSVKRPVYIIGTGRSGTTILGVVMSMHRRVGFLNEPKALWHSAYAYEDLIGSYSNQSANYRMDRRNKTVAVKSDLHKLYGAYLRMTASERVVDKYPELIFRTEFVKSIFPDARFLFLARNGWDTCVSIDRWSERLGVKEGMEIHDWWGRDNRKWHYLVDQLIPENPDLAPHQSSIRKIDDHKNRAAVEWIVSMREGLSLEKEDPTHVMRVDYEKLTADPNKWLLKIFEFCDLPLDQRCLEYGIKTLHAVPPRKPFELEKIIAAPFMETQDNLGY